MGRKIARAAAVALVAALPVVLGARQAPTRADATVAEQKVMAILARGGQTLATPQPAVRTSLSEREVNAFLQFSQMLRLPPGVANPRVTIADGGRLEGHAIVDLDTIRKSKDRGALDPLNYVSGAVEVAAVGTLKTANGQGTFDLQSATLSGVPIPKSILQELVTYYSRTPDEPNGIDIDKPFPLPASIRSVEIRQGSATIVQ
jgi:hypothetical protein